MKTVDSILSDAGTHSLLVRVLAAMLRRDLEASNTDLANKSTTPASETLPGDGAGVGVEAACQRQDHQGEDSS